MENCCTVDRVQSGLSEPIGWYDTHARELAEIYEAVDPDRLHAWMADLLPTEPSLVLDVGAVVQNPGRIAWMSGTSFRA